MKNTFVFVLASLSLVACASASWPTQVNSSAISDTPDRFLVADLTSEATSEPSGPACRSPLTDPRDGTRLTLVRSKAGFGDYHLDSPRYGLTGNQLLRINCSSGEAVGATPIAP